MAEQIEDSHDGNMGFVDRADRIQQEKREVILDAAKLVFDQKGLKGASMRAIAKAAKCTTGAIYPYFSGKEEIYGALLRRSLKTLQGFICPGNAVPQFDQRVANFVRFYVQNPGDFALGLYLYDQAAPIGVGEDLNQELNLLLMQAVRLVASGKTDPLEDKTAEATLLAILMGVVITYTSGRIKMFDFSIDQVAERLARVYSTSDFSFE